MKTRKVLGLLGLMMTLGVSGGAEAAGEIKIESSDQYAAPIGSGYYSEAEEFRGKCVTGSPIYVGRQQSNLSFSQSISQKQLSKELGMSAGGRARLGATTYSASAKFLKSSQSSSFSIVSIYSGNYTMKPRVLDNPALNQLGQKLKGNPERFQITCGDNFAYKQILGAKIFFSIRIDFKTEKAKQEFEANFNMSGPVYSASAHLRQAKNKFSKDTKVTISALQVGGDVSKISDVFKSMDGDGNNNGPYDFVKCSLGDLVKCETILTSAITYATDTDHGFPSQIKPDSDLNSPSGPAILATYAHPYEYMGEYIAFSPQLTRAIKQTRKRLNDKFETVYAQHGYADTIINAGTVRLSQRQRDKFIQMQAKLYDDLYSLAEGIEVCYNEPLECAPIFQEFDLGGENEIQHFAQEDFLVEREIFAQWCDFGRSSFSQAETAATVEAMIAAAKKIDPDMFAPAGSGLTVDECFVSGKVLDKSSQLDLSGKRLSDLRPLQPLTQLTNLNLSNNEINDVEPLAKLKNLKELVINRNRIVNVIPLSQLSKLESLTISDNDVRNTLPLGKLSRLHYLDLRNNHMNVECPFDEEGICLIADYRYNNDFVPLSRDSRKLPSRWGHRAVKVKNGDVIVTGGAVAVNGSNVVEYLQNHNTDFYPSGNIKRSRSFHTATLLDDNNILLTGGWAGGRSTEIVSTDMGAYVGQSVAKMNFSRASHRAVKLDNGSVLITGGWKGLNGFWTGRDAQATAEVYVPATRNFLNIGSMKVPRAGHSMTKLKDGRVLIVGGYKLDAQGRGLGLTSAEIFDPSSSSFKKLPARLRNGRGHHTATLLRDGRVLIAGGFHRDSKATNTLEIFDPKTNSFSVVKNQMTEARAYHQAVLLPDGKVFLVGGEIKFLPPVNTTDKCEGCSNTAEIFDPFIGLSTKTSAEMNIARSQFSATLTDDNRIIIIGGKGDDARFSAAMFEFSKF